MDQVVRHIFRVWTMSNKKLQTMLERMKPPSPISISKFYGKWYNIEALPQIFDAGCTDSSAIYSDDLKGGIHIENTCLLDGKWNPSAGTATVTSPDNSQLSAVFDYHGLPTPPIQLCIIRVSGGSYAMLGTPTLDGLWFMSRVPSPLPAAVDLEFRSVAANLGFDLRKMKVIEHHPSVLAQVPLTGHQCAP